MTPLLTKSQEGHQLIDELKTVISEETNEDVVALDGNVILDVGGVTYHEGQHHVTRQPGLLITDIKLKLRYRFHTAAMFLFYFKRLWLCYI
jgi:hypothetical protein